ncbi:LptF/LptG family permease [Rubripirellula reticaptiva]|uniref:Putative permease YjgP/YjgQ family protein n=1 Tax=Rubripirellula reticaptiva TaxID=2528013 RepID=A0A5C6F3X9_9BACT|nr:LptF/LptG family permease [Rubripirellula reticaptiva]TWU55230.1 putative permease YjgP/YjgQ family protein [Rubripirellula reticaptiva]
MTKIDRYILTLFLRTVLVCFCSIAGIFVVFHAFASMEELVKQGKEQGGLLPVMAGYYGPYLLLLFDWTGAIITLMAFLFTVGWLRRTGELTSTLAAGISHGRLLRPMIVASLLIVTVQLFSRELLLPGYRDALTMKAKDITGESEQPVSPQYDKVNRVLIDGRVLIAQARLVKDPSFRLDGDFPGFGDLLLAPTCRWVDADENHSGGYLLEDVQHPENIDELPSVGVGDRPIIYTSRDQTWLAPRQCFFATTVHLNLLQTKQSATRMASVAELIGRVRNPAVHSSLSLQVLMHERIIRPALDFTLILLGLPLVVNRRGRNLFVLIAVAMGTVLAFFMLKTLCGALGGNGYWLSPAMAAWTPLIVLGPLAYVRYRDVQIQ